MDTLTDAELNALHEALEDEYQSWSIYDQVIQDFGEVRPFINIRDAEARHIQALTRLFERYGVPLPANTWPGKVERYATVQAACEASVAAEIANGDLYERLFKTELRADILTVLTNLQEASLERHLPAFQRCAQGGTGQGGGQGNGRGAGGRRGAGGGQGRGRGQDGRGQQ